VAISEASLAAALDSPLPAGSHDRESVCHDSPPCIAGRGPLVSKRPRRDTDISIGPRHDPSFEDSGDQDRSRPSGALLPLASSSRRQEHAREQGESPPDGSTITIYPASPRVGVGNFETHVTPCLELLVDRLPLEKYFIRAEGTCAIKALERGHWEFEVPDSWDLGLGQKFWTFLAKFVKEGRAGWGTWMERATSSQPARCDGTEYRRGMERAGPAANEPPVLPGDVVRIWCWGEVVGHIWVLLYVASDGRIGGCGAKWIDGAGQKIIAMA
jgi:hypothetical protein